LYCFIVTSYARPFMDRDAYYVSIAQLVAGDKLNARIWKGGRREALHQTNCPCWWMESFMVQ